MDTTITADFGTNAAPDASRNSRNRLESPQEMQDRFLKLLIAQLRNQDPLSPVDNAQMTTQMAQISTVQGISALNETIGQLIGMQASNAAGLIGRDVLLAGQDLVLGPGGAGGAVRLSGPATDLLVDIIDASGRVVDSVSLGPQSGGLVRFVWDGSTSNGNRMPDGRYTFAATAVAGEVPVTTETYSAARVTSVGISNNRPTLSLDDGSREVGMSDIRQIL